MTLQANQQNRVAVEDYVNRNQLHLVEEKEKNSFYVRSLATNFTHTLLR